MDNSQSTIVVIGNECTCTGLGNEDNEYIFTSRPDIFYDHVEYNLFKPALFAPIKTKTYKSKIKKPQFIRKGNRNK